MSVTGAPSPRTPRPVRWFLVTGFRYGLGLRFGPRPSSEHVLGWAIVDRSPDSLTIESQEASELRPFQAWLSVWRDSRSVMRMQKRAVWKLVGGTLAWCIRACALGA
jgi:hypothetical protein